ncbi:hypothetical protein [Ohtaekwangia sp.]|uniref:hypothetical protein n=1 Tax=Ohtaekwangia sp. TaxID=2066019 RepID=UPI002F93FF2C
MKVILTSAFCFFLFGANAQWLPTGATTGNIYYTNGNVGIGTSDTKGYKFAVAGKAAVEEITVKLSASWPDYVFASSYRLPSLSDLEKFIVMHRHLPEIASAEEISKTGVDIGEMNILLLKKVEELTLYIIELEKKNNAIEARLELLEKK